MEILEQYILSRWTLSIRYMIRCYSITLNSYMYHLFCVSIIITYYFGSASIDYVILVLAPHSRGQRAGHLSFGLVESKSDNDQSFQGRKG